MRCCSRRRRRSRWRRGRRALQVAPRRATGRAWRWTGPYPRDRSPLSRLCEYLGQLLDNIACGCAVSLVSLRSCDCPMADRRVCWGRPSVAHVRPEKKETKASMLRDMGAALGSLPHFTICTFHFTLYSYRRAEKERFFTMIRFSRRNHKSEVHRALSEWHTPCADITIAC